MKKLYIYTTNEITSAVKECESVKEWGIFNVWNDKRKDGTRRLKFMRNGWQIPSELQNRILKEVGITLIDVFNVNSIEFKTSIRNGYGDYAYLEIIKDESL